MASIDWNEIAKKATEQTDAQLANQLAGLTRMNTEEITNFIKESSISNTNAIKVLKEVHDATNTNSQKAEAIANINNGVNFLVSYLSKFMSLQPGDIISTGTPPGVGMGMKPQVFLKKGDEMKLGIEGLGEQVQKTISA